MMRTILLNLFDRLHYGHQVIIDRLIDMESPSLGVIDGELIPHNTELAALIQPHELRIKMLSKYIKSLETGLDIPILGISSYSDLESIKGEITFLMFDGPCCREIEEEALTRRNCQSDRFELMKPVRAADGDKMSSARLRGGEIDRKGRKLKGTSQPPRILPMDTRSKLKAPKGELYHIRDGTPEERIVEQINKESPEIVISVGDVSSETIQNAGFTPDVMVVDGITKRGTYQLEIEYEEEYKIYNPQATLYPEAWSVMDSAISDEKKSMIYVEGEEDMMGFPAVLLAKSNSVMLYGQPNEGIVWVSVTQENQKIAQEFLDQMPIIH